MKSSGAAEHFEGVYVYGTDDGQLIKIGETKGLLSKRRESLERGQLTPVRLHLLAAIRSDRRRLDQNAVLGYFAEHKADVNSTETLRAAPPVVEWVNWLRQQWATWSDEDFGPPDVPDYQTWAPRDDRRVGMRAASDDALFQLYDVEPGGLAGTPWAALSIPQPRHNDYYTPLDVVETARVAMGGIDLDPASSWWANRYHKIPTYYHLGRKAEDNPWFGRVWLNPPYGDWGKWFGMVAEHWDAGHIEQACVLSPMWALVTPSIAPVLLRRASRMLLFMPTPPFWGREQDRKGRPGRTSEPDNPIFGSNHPHAITYLGPRGDEFAAAFRSRGFVFHAAALLAETEAEAPA